MTVTNVSTRRVQKCGEGLNRAVDPHAGRKWARQDLGGFGRITVPSFASLAPGVIARSATSPVDMFDFERDSLQVIAKAVKRNASSRARST